MMRYWLVLLVLSLAACADDGLTRSFGTNRDSGPEITAPGQMPLSTPPALSDRPKRPGLIALNGDAAGQPLSQGPVSVGQDALVQAAGPTAGADVRAKVDDNSGLVYPSPAFTDRVMNWTVPPGYQTLVTKASKGWFSGWF